MEEKQWYVVYTQGRKEKKAVASLQAEIKEKNLYHLFGDFLCPEQKVVTIVEGRKRVTNQLLYPNYFYINMVMNSETWNFVKSNRYVSHFIGESSSADVVKPVPVKDVDMENVFIAIEQTSEAVRPSTDIKVGELVRIKDGSFTDFTGVINSVNVDKGTFKVDLNVLGRNIPVDMPFNQVMREV